MGTSSDSSAMSRKASSLSGDSKTKSTWGRCPSWSHSPDAVCCQISATSVSQMTPVMTHGNQRAVRAVIPVYREKSLVKGRWWGRGQADLGEKAPYRTTAGSTLIPGFLPRSWGSRNYEMGQVEHSGWPELWGNASYEMGKVEHGSVEAAARAVVGGV